MLVTLSELSKGDLRYIGSGISYSRLILMLILSQVGKPLVSTKGTVSLMVNNSLYD